MSSPLHTELKTLAQGQPAAYLTIAVLRDETIARLIRSAADLTGKEIPVGQQVLSASLIKASFPGGTSPKLVPGSAPDAVDLDANADLLIDVEVYVSGDRKAVISTVSFTVKNLRIHISAKNNNLVIEGTDFDAPSLITRSPNADAILKAAGINPLEAARVEGHIAYGVVTSALAATLGQRQELSLSTLFKALDFGTTIRLVPLQQGQFLGILPSGTQLNTKAHCECKEGPNLDVDETKTTNIHVPPNPKPNDQFATVHVGGPVAEKLDPMKDLGKRGPGTGRAGLLLQQATYSAMTVTAMPSLGINASDDGFIGFEAHGNVDFSGFRVSLDAPRGGIIVDIDMKLGAYAISWMNLGKGIRLPLGIAAIRPAPGSQASLELGFYPFVDSGGTVRLRGTLQRCDMGNYIAVVVGVGSALKLFGVTAWIGFLIDIVLSGIISHNLPGVLRNEVVKYIGQNEWELLDGGEIVRNEKTAAKQALWTNYDIDNDTFLVSFDYRKD